MINFKNIAEDTIWIGGSDRRLELFENLFPRTSPLRTSIWRT